MFKCFITSLQIFLDIAYANNNQYVCEIKQTS